MGLSESRMGVRGCLLIGWVFYYNIIIVWVCRVSNHRINVLDGIPDGRTGVWGI